MTSRRILVVEPDPDTRAFYRECLGRDDVTVVEAADGREALVKALAHPPTLVVTDLRLPLLDGHALCGILRQDRLTAHVAVLVVTADARPERLELVRQAGADAVIVKPITPKALVEAAQRLLQQGGHLCGAPTDDRDALEGRAPGPAPRTTLTRMHQRFAPTTPPHAPPALFCPTCDAPLRYEQSQVGGVSSRHPEQWDYYVCATCGMFQFRHRTRRLRRV